MGCHLLLQCMKVKRESEVAQSCPTLSDPVLYCLFILDGMKICSSPSFKTKSRFFREEELYNGGRPYPAAPTPGSSLQPPLLCSDCSSPRQKKSVLGDRTGCGAAGRWSCPLSPMPTIWCLRCVWGCISYPEQSAEPTCYSGASLL